MSKRLRYGVILISCLLVMYIVIGGVLGQGTSTNEQTYRDLGVYSEVLSRIKSNYVTEPNLEKVTGGAIRGLLQSLDPYSTYFTPEQFKNYLAHPNPGPATVGIFASERAGFAAVVSVRAGSPADKAGIIPGDLIDRINDKPVRELSAVQIERELAGEPGTTVDVWIVSESEGKPKKFTLTREALGDPPVTARMANSDTGYVYVGSFYKGVTAEIAAKVKQLEGEGAKSLVLDLRDCAGGEPDEAVQTASLFIPSGLITYTYGQQDPRHNYMAAPSGSVFRMPLAVLINRATAGPAEIVADAVLGRNRGDVVGHPSFGVGVVQKVIPVGDGSGLLLSVAKYYGPNGTAIQGNGVTPNVLVPAPGEVPATNGPVVEPKDFGTSGDVQYQRALEILKGQIPAGKAA